MQGSQLAKNLLTEKRPIFYSDESKFDRNFRGAKRCYARSRADVKLRQSSINVTFSVMVWGMIGRNYKSDLVVYGEKPKIDSEVYLKKCFTLRAGTLPAR